MLSNVMTTLAKIALLLVLPAICARPQSFGVPDGDVKSADAAFHAGAAAMSQNDLSKARSEFEKVVHLAPQVALGHSALGAVLLAQSNTAGAIVELEKAHQLDPKDNAATLNLATAYCVQNSYTKSVQLFQMLEAANVRFSPSQLASYARALEGAGDVSEAEIKLKAALSTAPEDSRLHDDLGLVLLRAKRFAEAETEFRTAIGGNENSAPFRMHLGESLLQAGKLEEAVAQLTTAVRLAPDNADAQLQLGSVLQSAGLTDEAISHLRRASELNQESIEAKYGLALALQTRGDVAEALPLFQQVAIARPLDAAVLTNLGLVLVQSGKASESLPFYHRALRLTPNDPTLLQDIGVAALQQSDFDMAIEQFRAGLAMSPNSAQLHYDLGFALKMKDKIPEAVSEFELAAKNDPSLPDPHQSLGVLYMQMGRSDEAIRELLECLALGDDKDPSYKGNAWTILGSLYKRIDEPDKAIDALHHAIALLPSRPSPHVTLGAILAQQGDAEGAKAERKIGADLMRTAFAQQKVSFAIEAGKRLRERGDLAGASQKLEQALVSDPDNAIAHRELAIVFQLQGKEIDAAMERRRADGLERNAGLSR
jgi:tetratricopeptide (TPR) repeat protein